MRSSYNLQLKNILCIFFFVCCMGLQSSAQDCGPISTTRLKELLTGMGFTVKNTNEEGKTEKFEIKNAAGGLDIPTTYEISGSTNYIWITVFLGKAKDEGSAANTDLLKQNANIQPCLFYITAKGNIMMGLPVENRAVTSAVLKRCNDFISARVGETKTYWQN